jgi:hypothetical protein
MQIIVSNCLHIFLLNIVSAENGPFTLIPFDFVFFIDGSIIFFSSLPNAPFSPA